MGERKSVFYSVVVQAYSITVMVTASRCVVVKQTFMVSKCIDSTCMCSGCIS